MANFTPEEKSALLTLARQAIAAHLNGKPLPPTTQFTSPGSVFVSLHKNNELRGCIGSFLPQPLGDAVVENAIAAANDPRLPPVGKDELRNVDLEISILDEPQPLPYRSIPELLEKLDCKKPGVILQLGRMRATFLPQVWNELQDPKDFLSHLCLKAGLPANAWQVAPIKIFTYSAEVLH